MNPVAKALWYIESYFAGEITLENVAAAAGVSRFRVSRSFGVATGRSIMRYTRGRRLTEAARALATGVPDILAVALDAGYGSHEAFTRAFRDQFDLTPEAVRAQRRLDNLELMEPIRMDETPIEKLEAPRFEDAKPMLVAGLGGRYHGGEVAGIPAQWQRFKMQIDSVPGRIGSEAYGVCCNSDAAGNFDYICAVAVKDFSRIPAELTRVRIPAQRYAVFRHDGHISTIRQTWNAIIDQWLPASGFRMADAPDFERYGESFDPQKGTGGVEIWIPVRQGNRGAN